MSEQKIQDDVGKVDRRFRLAQATGATSAIRLFGRSAIAAGRTECRWVADGDPHIFQDRFKRVDQFRTFGELADTGRAYAPMDSQLATSDVVPDYFAWSAHWRVPYETQVVELPYGWSAHL